MAKKRQTKTQAAAVPVPQDLPAINAAIAEIGMLQRARADIETAMNADLAAVKEAAEGRAAPMAARIRTLAEGLRIACDARRSELTKGGRSKTAKLQTGEVSWRMRPPRVVVRGADAVIERLNLAGLKRFLRTKTELNREAILADPQAASAIDGISVGSAGEEFVIKPTGSDLEAVS